ncbi:MAG: hypothetical protein BECKG1743D_GA0114223_101853 [Candidatus Kentron sp. G]|nr:MAG: hypothetical protein BECKG1743F_GA0114225_102373 [Candidatus Kentron sp. G]VFM98594.1 MAG: hypothetical protein BECKG1743E_GA0114224_101985 [Candidatus Kentron sp. G]VFN00338.1 MAG: hypothetical protein BECKG1743D_GA0114223_101853 [Candidatus Kentron sp. G]
MVLTADESGRVTGSFTIPSGVSAGTKSVEITGSGGSRGATTYTGSGTITIQQQRRVTTVWTGGSDPLAQTFTLEEGRHIGGVDLWFTRKGQSSVRVQIRETTTGLPNGVVLSEGEISADGVSLIEPTRIQWSPVWLEPDREYALVIMTDDAEHTVKDDE